MRNLKVIEGGRDDDLVTTIIRAIEMARSCRSNTTLYLLKMALLNEGIRLADDLLQEQPSLLDQKEALAADETFKSTSPAVRPRAARPRQSPAPDRGRPQVGGRYLSIEDPAPSARPNVKPSSNGVVNFLASFPPRD